MAMLSGEGLIGIAGVSDATLASLMGELRSKRMVVPKCAVMKVLHGAPHASIAQVLQGLQDRDHFIPAKSVTCFLCGHDILAVEWTRHAYRGKCSGLDIDGESRQHVRGALRRASPAVFARRALREQSPALFRIKQAYMDAVSLHAQSATGASEQTTM